MAHPDESWRVGAIYRCCVRYYMPESWAYNQLCKIRHLSTEGNVIAGHSFPKLANIWFRKSNPKALSHIEQAQRTYHHGEPHP